ncbi:E3 ubiquitin-protein ligase RFWD3-like [Anoplophora glabripennis]|nr:E3 ubiquitin-protein ligase RFWD3-like [Anoplophora glabripennis]
MEYSNAAYIPDENAMDVDAPQLSGQNMTAQGNPTVSVNDDRFDVVVVSSVGLHVEGPIPFINPEIPVEQHAIVQIESNDVESNSGDTDRVSPAISVASSRAPSPVDLPEESNQSECINSENDEKESRKRSLSEDDDDGRLCPICLDNWTNTGEHRICALKCGHLFGYKCVNRWLESQQKKSCPTCKKRVNRSDLRYIYAKKLIAVDTTELDVMKQLLDTAVEEKNKILMDISKYACREHMLNQEIAQLKKQIQELTNNRSDLHSSQSNGGGSSSFNPLNSIVRLFMDKSLEICRQGGCRVFDANCQLDLIMTSMKSPNSLFSGFGIRKVNISQYKPLAFIPLHTLQIRDITFHPVNNWVLTASMDKSFKVVDTISNSVMYTTSQQMPLWSCCWDADNQYVLYIGTQSGVVVKYDVRTLHQPVCTLAVTGDMSPVVSVASIPSSPGTDLVQGGVVSCKLNSLWVFENSGNDHVRHSLSLEGPFVSMKYQSETKQLLVSSRPNNRISYSRHTLCTLEKVSPYKMNCNVIHSFQGGGMQKLLSKSCFLSDKHEYVAAHHESSKSVYLWSINTGQRVCSVPAHDAVLDLRGIQNHNGNYLVSLTEKKMEFFKFN